MKKNRIAEQFIAITREMRESLAWQHLPDNARRVLDRIEVEHMRHGGAKNGRLIVTYNDFRKWSLRRDSVALAIRQCCVLGFLEITHRGGRSISAVRCPSHYRLTYASGCGKSAPKTDDWKRVRTEADARSALHAAQSKSWLTQAPRNPRHGDGWQAVTTNL